MKAQLTQGWIDNAIWIERVEMEIRAGFKENGGRKQKYELCIAALFLLCKQSIGVRRGQYDQTYFSV